ncbi:anti-sigma factor domain-containing protein [Streptomyces sp. NPDC058662]|uniref:anti-sigma factor n=1 Tax=Streptomyces sp. NPDC058662 TaxID=3346583 RepID=UPI00364F79FE
MNKHHDDLHALTAAYALGALEESEREAFATHLDGCEVCRVEVAEFEETAARMAGAAAQPPPAALRPRVLAGIDAVRQLPPRLSPPTVGVRRWTAPRGRAASFAVAASLAAAVSFAGMAAWQHQGSQDAERREAQSRQRLDQVSAVLAAPDARPVHGRAGNGALTSVVTSKQLNKAVFTAANMPDPGPGATYQLWLDHDGTMRPAGLMDRDGTVVLTGDPAGASGVGLTLEPAGGSDQPTTDPLLLLPLPA